MDAQTITHGISQAEAIFTMIGGLTLLKVGEFGVAQVRLTLQRRRDAKAALAAADAARLQAAVDAAKAEAAKEQKLQAVETMQAREIRRDAVDEWQQIAAERDKEKHSCHERLVVVEREMDECKEDRSKLRSTADRQQAEINELKSRVTIVENGHGKS